ncbi:MAG: DUF551 domain-containing protein [Lachnospiraceae bacterium]|nr:DUF551 domain-containing protein [Lachnospiraceae bacterium]
MQEVFEKIIAKLEEKRKIECVFTRDKYSEGVLRGISYGIESVNQVAAEYKGGWIPCSVRLPKYGEVVMCSCTNSGITISCITHKGVKPSESVRFGQHSVIAWQPLPQPYQPKGKKPMTNADRIREMSDEELAEWLTSITDDAQSDAITRCDYQWSEWLQSEAN